MKGKYLVLGFTAVLSMAFVSDVHERDSLLVSSIIQGLSYSHYAPANIDDNFSKNVYKEYLERLDPAKRFFIQEDINALNAYEFKIDDEIKASEYNFFDLSNELLEKRITVVKSFYQSLLSNPFDFNIDENI